MITNDYDPVMTEKDFELRDKMLSSITMREVVLMCKHCLTLDQKNTMHYDISGSTFSDRPAATLSECIDHVLE